MKTLEVVRLLNEWLEKDPNAIQALFSYRVPADGEADTTFIVNEKNELGMIGIINGIFFDDRIAIVTDESDKILWFERAEVWQDV